MIFSVRGIGEAYFFEPDTFFLVRIALDPASELFEGIKLHSRRYDQRFRRLQKYSRSQSHMIGAVRPDPRSRANMTRRTTKRHFKQPSADPSTPPGRNLASVFTPAERSKSPRRRFQHRKSCFRNSEMTYESIHNLVQKCESSNLSMIPQFSGQDFVRLGRAQMLGRSIRSYQLVSCIFRIGKSQKIRSSFPAWHSRTA